MGLLGRLTGKVRCPACSSFARHPLDRDREAEIKRENRRLSSENQPLPPESTLRLYETMGVSLEGKKTPRAFVCLDCGEAFDLGTEMIWAAWAKKLGDEAVVVGYCEARDALREESSQ